MKQPSARRPIQRSEHRWIPRGRTMLIVWLALMAVAGPLAAVAAGAGDSRATTASAARGTTTGPGSGGGGLGPTVTVTTPVGTVTLPPSTTTTPATSGPPPTIPPGPGGSPLRQRGMWIWVLASSDGGNLGQIAAHAKSLGIRTLIIKSSDGGSMWPQFNPSVVASLHASHLHVCAWQFVYGNQPAAEAQAGAQAVRDGADCLVIDAETDYQGKYVQAQTYLNDLRQTIGTRFPLALAGFPYIDYHPSFPYSVFLGPGGAQYNTPQMYWRDIGTSVPVVFAHTYAFNEIYQRPIEPLGQLYGSPPAWQIRQFRSVSRYYHASGISWWDWQAAPPAAFRAVAQPAGPINGFTPYTTVASIGLHALGDLVVWAQEHLVSAGEQLSIDGDFGAATQSAVENFQSQHGLSVTGVIDPPTWAALLRYRPVAVKWVVRKKHLTATTARAASRRAGGAEVLVVPRSAHLGARRNELAGAGGAGMPHRAAHTS